ncbi:MAG: O-antigen ligase family protein [Ruminococcaceae bacterium]|nr:O-antigen ligase family protein [Oscillospiraceae bacterium]
MQKQNNSLIVIIFAHFAVIFTVLSQMLNYQRYFRPMMFACWGIVLAYSLLAKKAVYINSYIKTFGLTMLFILLHNIVAFFIYDKIQISNYFQVALIPLFVFFTMFQVAGHITPEQFDKILVTYCVCGVFLALYLHIEYVPDMNTWLSSEVYIYGSKNSAAQIFISTAIILLFYFKSDKKAVNILKCFLVIYLAVISMLLQCRTALLGFVCVVAYYVFIRSDKKRRLFFLIILLLGVLFVISNKSLWEIVEHTFFLDKYDDADLNQLSSGRLDLWVEALQMFSQKPILGNIYYYVDGMYISVYAALGIIGGTAILIPWFKRVSRNFKALSFAQKHKSITNLESTICYLTIFYLIESTLEGYPPFGPGACSAMYWLLCAYMDYTYYKPPQGSLVPIDSKLAK